MIKIVIRILCTFILLMLVPLNAHAEESLVSRADVLNFLEKAFQAQVSLSDKERSLSEIDEMLNPIFTDDYKKIFLKENLVQQNGKFITFGSDFAPYYIPYFAFSDKTKVVFEEDSIYIVEFFPGNVEGPVTYKDHYEGIQLIKEDQWKVNDFLYNDLPKEVVEKINDDVFKNEYLSYGTKAVSSTDFVLPRGRQLYFM